MINPTPKQIKRATKIKRLMEVKNPLVVLDEELEQLDQKDTELEQKINNNKANSDMSLGKLAGDIENLEETKADIKEVNIALSNLARQPGPPGDKGDKGDSYILTPYDMGEIASKVKIEVPVVEKIIEKVEIIKEQPIVTNNVTEVIKEVAITDTPEVLVTKLNTLLGKIDPKTIVGFPELKQRLDNLSENLAMPVTTTHFYKDGAFVGRAKNINFSGATVSVSGDQANVTISSSGGGGSSGFQQPLMGAVNGVNATYTWTTAPNVIVRDGAPMQKVQSDGTVNWTGTTTTVLSQPPSFDIYSTA